jgi:hypothetical protein
MKRCTARDQLLKARFRTPAMGMSRDQMVRLMGEPSWEDRCGAKIPTGIPAPCAKELGNSETLAPLLPSYYLIWFGNDGQVVHTAPITSAPGGIRHLSSPHGYTDSSNEAASLRSF